MTICYTHGVPTGNYGTGHDQPPDGASGGVPVFQAPGCPLPSFFDDPVPAAPSTHNACGSTDAPKDGGSQGAQGHGGMWTGGSLIGSRSHSYTQLQEHFDSPSQQ